MKASLILCLSISLVASVSAPFAEEGQSSIGEATGKVIKGVKEGSKEVWDGVSEGSKEAWEATKEGSSEAWDATKEGVGKVRKSVGKAISGE
jgi:phage-related minor tail protein